MKAKTLRDGKTRASDNGAFVVYAGEMETSPAAREALRMRPPGWPVLRMRWEKLVFLHWRWKEADLQRRVPEGLTIDTHEGEAWLGIVPFFMRGVRPTGLPAIPVVSNFLELNVRTYVVDRRGRPGVWFFSLACNQGLAVEVARRTYGLNYVHARMKANESGSGGVEYHCIRRDSGRESTLEYDPVNAGEPARSGTLEYFLLERYLLFACTPHGTLVSGRVHHTPYLARPTEVRRWDFQAGEADGFRHPGRGPDHVLAAAPVDVKAWLVRRADGE